MTDNNDKLVQYNRRHELLNLIDIDSLKEILNAFTTTTGLMANVVDVSGRSIFSRKNMTKCCKFCKLIMNMEHGLAHCHHLKTGNIP